jgi:hypothetical protein
MTHHDIPLDVLTGVLGVIGFVSALVGFVMMCRIWIEENKRPHKKNPRLAEGRRDEAR